jgi:hypothetical protein
VRCELDENRYPKAIRVADEEMAALRARQESTARFVLLRCRIV